MMHIVGGGGGAHASLYLRHYEALRMKFDT